MTDRAEQAQMIEDCELRESRLSNWEANFIDSISRQLAEGRNLTLNQYQFVGASLRDYFAAKAMQGFLSSYQNGAVDCGLAHLADDAYDMADAMLKARAKGGAE